MKRLNVYVLAVALAVFGLGNRMLLAEDGDNSLYPPLKASSSGYQPVSAQAPNVVGYKPIPIDALTVPASRKATLVPPSGAAKVQLRPAAVATTQTSQPREATAETGDNGSKLPVSYLTGVVGGGLYTLGRDDVIHIDVQNQPDFTGDFVVGYAGRIQYNYLGDIPVAGMTKYEVQQVMEKLLKEYIRTPVVSVTILAYNSKVVYVIGEVNSPGKFIMRGDVIKLREAILAAGLPTNRAALSRVHVIKPDIDDPQVRVINFKKILYKGKLKDDIDLHPGEIVVVPSTVMSKVNDFLASILSPVTRAAHVAALSAL